jgi:hypothetical protein
MISSEPCISGLNLQAAALIQNGDNKQAIALLVKAVSLLSSQLNGNETPVPVPQASLTTPAGTKNSAFGGDVASTALKVTIATNPHESSTPPLVFKPHAMATCLLSSSATATYNRPFFLPPLNREYSVANMAETTAFLLFNMALACQQEGTRTASSKKTSNALLIYKKALETLEGTAVHESSELALLFLAIVNNMAHIQVETFDADGRNVSLKMLRSVLFHKDRAKLDVEQSGFFFLNLMFLEQAGVFKHPAAA